MTKKNRHTEEFIPFNLVVFGGDGDLALRKIYPALFHRDQDGQFLTDYNVIAVTRKNVSGSSFNESLLKFLKESAEEDTTENYITIFSKKVQLIQVAEAT